MAERNPGPVKPPTIDLTARETIAAPEGVVEPVPALEPVVEAAPVAETTAEATPKRPRPARRVPPKAAAPEPPAAPEEMIPPGVRAAEAVPEATLPAERESPVPPPPPEPPAQTRSPEPQPQPVMAQPAAGPRWGQLAAAAVAGALLGTALTYTLGAIVPLPSDAPVIADPADDLAGHAQRLSFLEERFAAVEESAMDTQVSLDATIAQLDGGLNEVRGSIAETRAAIPQPVDAAAVETRLRTLAARVDAIAAGASSADAGALAEQLADLEAMLRDLSQQVSGLDQRTSGVDAALTELRTNLDGVQAVLAEQASPALPQPEIGTEATLAINGLEAAFAAGRPYAAELEALKRIAPETAVPDALAARAASGLPSPETLANRFAAVVPEMIAARPSAPEAGWQDTTVDWLKALLALRPAGEVEGDAPEAVMARLEAAMERRDLAAAAALFPLLPPEMRAAASDLPGAVALHAEAAAWLETLRSPPAAEAAQ